MARTCNGRTPRLVAVLLGAALLAAGAAPLALRAQDSDELPEWRRLMRENFSTVERIFAGLSGRHYEAVATDVKLLIEHAEEIGEKQQQRGTLFHAYLFKLRAHADNLLMLAEALAENPEAPVGADADMGEGNEYLHDVAAADFGEIVATCIACHGRYVPE